MRYIAIVLNTLTLMLFLWIKLSIDNLSQQDAGESEFFMFVVVITAIVNIITFVHNKTGNLSWVGLFLKRKAIEEKKKIAELEKSIME